MFSRFIRHCARRIGPPQSRFAQRHWKEYQEMAADFDTVYYFTDQSLVPDRIPPFDHLRSKWSVVPLRQGSIEFLVPEEPAERPRLTCSRLAA